MIKITFLGTVSGIPSIDRNHPAICLEYFGEEYHCLLFDCGENTQVQFMKSNISFMNVDKIFITHWHADHFAGLIPLIQTMNMEDRKKELKIFAPDANRFVKKILELSYYKPLFEIVPIDVDYKKNEILRIHEEKEFEIFSIPVEHTVPAVAYCFKERDRIKIDEEKLDKLNLKRGRWLRILKEKGVYNNIRLEDVSIVKKGYKIVYSGDTKPCEQIVKISDSADILIHDATFFEEEEADGKYHTDFKEAINIAKLAKVKFLILTHLSRRYRDLDYLEEEARKLFPYTKIARDLMQIVLKDRKLIIGEEQFNI